MLEKINHKAIRENQNQIMFDEVMHRYTVNGKILPSVSEIMKPLSDGYYQGIDKSTMQRASDRGTRVHKAVEMFAQFGIETDDEDIKPYLLAYKMAYALEGFEPLANEIMLTNHKYCGTIDMIAEMDGGLVIIDLKATSKINYDLLEVQLQAYKELANYVELNIKETYVLHLKKGKYKLERITPNEMLWEDLKKNAKLHFQTQD